ncbi:MAG: sulfite exporter TauE/SafE family protein, partial [Armatimonadetes bacterium]|nr:sulfite exporter TauE/SafE family protein [Armatimonadota bacterium]
MKIHWIVLPIGLLAQYVDGSLGMGYGASSASFLLAVGMMPAAMSASIHLAEIFSSLASGISHIKMGNVERRIVIPLSISGVVGGIFGAYCLSSVDGKLFKPYIALILLALGIKIVWTFARRKPAAKPARKIRKGLLVPLGLIGGAVDAIGGGGWGPICTPALAMNIDEPRMAVGSVDTAEFLTTIAITATFAAKLGLETFVWSITLPLLIGGIIAAPIAAYTCR